MKIAIISRSNHDVKWGGDLRALELIHQGMLEIDVEARLLPNIYDVTDEDHIILSNTVHDLRGDSAIASLMQKSYSVIGFHENFIQYFGAATGFYTFVALSAGGEEDLGIPLSIEMLKENPDIAYYYAAPPKKCGLVNFSVMQNAKACIANSPTERATMLRDCPSCNAQSVFWPPGLATDFSHDFSDDFLKITGLKSKEYILQVGRLEFRKNQLATILATKDLDIPLVFIATKGNLSWYEEMCIKAAMLYRKAPTIIVAQAIAPIERGAVKVIPMPEGKKLPIKTLQGALFHAALNLHPAFQELPGFTYLESLKLGVPTIASSWTTINDYLQGDCMDGLIQYSAPHDLKTIERLVIDMLGKKISPPTCLPSIFSWTPKMTAELIMQHITSSSAFR
jgi:hypothetical protein